MGFVLLSSPEFDVERFRAVLREDWGIECPEDAANPRSERDGIALAFEVNGMMATVGLMEAKVPGGEAEYWANSNFMTREASIAAAKAHQAHLLVAVLGRGHAPLEAGELFVKVACACLKAPNVLGIYDCGTVWMPEHFMESAMVMKEGEPPLGDLVFVGLYRDEKGVSSWTNGMRSFGREELEIIHSSRQPSEVYDLMWNVSAYLIRHGAVLRDGETLGFTAVHEDWVLAGVGYCNGAKKMLLSNGKGVKDEKNMGCCFSGMYGFYKRLRERVSESLF